MWTFINLLLTLGKRSIVRHGTLDFFLLPGHLRCFANFFGGSKSLKPLSWAKSLTTDLELSSTFLSDDRGCPLDDFFHEMQIIVCAVFGECHPRGGGTRPKIGKNVIFWHKIVIFHTKYPKQFFKCTPPNLKL